MKPVIPQEFAEGIAKMMESAENHGGGRHACCQRGMCALHLAEDRPGRNLTSTIHLGRSIAVVPNYDGQELVAAFTLAAIDRAQS